MGRPEAARRAWARARELFAAHGHHALMVFTLLGGDARCGADVCRRERADGAGSAPGRRPRGARRRRPAAGRPPRRAWLGCLLLEGRWARRCGSSIRRHRQCAPAAGKDHAHGCSRSPPRRDGERLGGDSPAVPHGPATEPGDILHGRAFLQRLAAALPRRGRPSAARAWLAAHDRWLAWSGAILARPRASSAGRLPPGGGRPDRARAAAADPGPRRDAAHRSPPRRPPPARRVGHRARAVRRPRRTSCQPSPGRRLRRALRAGADPPGPGRAPPHGDDRPRRYSTRCVGSAHLGAAPALARADALAARLATTQPDKTFIAGLTERELDVLSLLPEDLTLEQIAARLFVSYSTVKTHLDHIRDKFGSASGATSSPGPPNSGSSLPHAIPRPRDAWGMVDVWLLSAKSPTAVDARARCEAHSGTVLRVTPPLTVLAGPRT